MTENCNASNVSIQILNRWGELVFQTTDITQAWDGIASNGVPVVEGVYYYIVEYQFMTGQTGRHTGIFHIFY